MKDLTFSEQNSFLHHGIEGQKWGIRNGPPYPLDEKHNGSEKNKNQDNNTSDIEKEKKFMNDNIKDLKRWGSYTYDLKTNGVRNKLHVDGDREKSSKWNKRKKQFEYDPVDAEESLKRKKEESKLLQNINEKNILKQLYDMESSYNWAKQEYPTFNDFYKDINLQGAIVHYINNDTLRPVLEFYTNQPEKLGYHSYSMEYNPKNKKISYVTLDG